LDGFDFKSSHITSLFTNIFDETKSGLFKFVLLNKCWLIQVEIISSYYYYRDIVQICIHPSNNFIF